jgi:hypothetical protein
VVLLNVLEHIPDDHQALGDIYESLAPAEDGVVGAGLRGALRRLRSTDRSLPQVSPPRVAALVHKTGFQQVTAKYTNLPGFFAWWLVVRVLGRLPPPVVWQ